MCTVSWTAGVSGYELFFNRDELNTRAAEAAPEPAQREGVAYIAPRDGKHGGTWLLANEFGLTVCLLNDYETSWRPESSRPPNSRGQVVLACAAASNHAEVLAAVDAQPLSATAAFRLVALSPVEGPLVVEWRGRQPLRQSPAHATPPLTSSSFATAEVIAARQSRFASFVRSTGTPGRAELAAYHRQHALTAGAHSVLMRRPDAATRSIIHVEVDEREVRLSYEPVQWTDRGAAMLAPIRATLTRRSQSTLAA